MVTTAAAIELGAKVTVDTKATQKTAEIELPGHETKKERDEPSRGFNLGSVLMGIGAGVQMTVMMLTQQLLGKDLSPQHMNNALAQDQQQQRQQGRAADKEGEKQPAEEGVAMKAGKERLVFNAAMEEALTRINPDSLAGTKALLAMGGKDQGAHLDNGTSVSPSQGNDGITRIAQQAPGLPA